MLKTHFFMRHLLLFIFGIVLTTLLPAQPSSTFFSTFDAERGNVLAPASGGSLWLGGMKDERVLLTKLSTDGKTLSKHSIDFEGLGLDTEHLVDFFEETDGTLVGCGNFENDSQARGFVFRYDPAAKQVVWAHIVRSGGLNYLYGITQLGPGGDYVLYGNPHFASGDNAELLRLSRSTGQIVLGQAKRFGIGPFNNITQAVYHNGALYTCGRFTGTEPFPDARMRNAICKVDPATLEPLWTRLGPLPTSSSGRFYGRDLIIDNGAILSTFSGDHTGPVLTKSEVFLQKNDLDGNPLWLRQYKLPAFKGEFAEEVISLPDGYMLYGYDFLTDTSRLFLLKTDKEGEVITAAKIDFGLNDEFSEIPARSKILRVGDALFLTALSENNLGQTQGILVKTDLDGWLSDSCGFVKKTPATFSTWEPNVSQLLVPTVTPSPATTEAATTSLSTPDLAFSKKCGADGTCPTLSDLRLTLDSISCANGEPLLHYTFCNMGGQTYEGSAFFGLYDKNPLTEKAKLVTVIIHTGNALAPGECISDVVASNSLPPMSFLLDTFSVLYGLMGINLATTTPVMLSSFPFPPNSPECGYANNLDSFEVKKPICAPDSCHPNTFWKIFGRQGNWINISALRAAPDGNLYMVGRQDDHLTIGKMAPDGQFVWTRSLTLAPLLRPLISEIIVDSEGMIVGSGNLTAPNSGENKGAFAFRYNPTTDQVLWAQRFIAFRSTEGGILEKTPGGNFLLHYNPSIVGTDAKRAEILELDRATGQIVPAFAKRYEYQYSQAFSNVVAHNGAIYTTGYTIRQVGNTGFRRMVMSKLDASTGDVIWSRTGLTDWPQNSDFAGGDLIVDDNSLLALYYGNETGNAVGNAIKLYLQKTTLDGEVLWVKKYDLAAFPRELVATPDGYVIFSGASARTFLKTDKEGNLLVSKRLDSQAYFIGSAGIGEQNQAERIGQHLYFAHETARANQVYGYTTLLKTDLNLEMEFDCAFSPFPITYSSVAVKPNIEAPQTVTASPSVQEAVVTTLSPDVIVVHKSCPTCATESCTDLPDITARVDSITCSPTQGAVAHIRVCNLGQATPAAGFHLTFYGKNPLVGNAMRLQSVFLQEMPAPGQCLQTVLPLNALLLQNPKVYTLAGVDGNVQPPIALDVFPFVNGYTECNYANNLDSFEVILPDPKKLDLGPDRAICTGQMVTLDAGSGYATYLWANGPSQAQLTVEQPGNYRVTVTDACGRLQEDAVRVLASFDCDTASCASSTFLRVIGEPDVREWGGCLQPSGDGNLYMAGRKNERTFFNKIDPDGKVLWARSFVIGNTQAVSIPDFIVDSEGMIVGLAQQPQSLNASRGMVFRYNPVSDQMLWFDTIVVKFPRNGGVAEKSPGGNFLLYHMFDNQAGAINATEILEIDRTSGQVVPVFAKQYDYIGNHLYTSMVVHQGALYGTGFVPRPFGALINGNPRPVCTRFDLGTGTEQWSQLVHRDTAAHHSLIGGDIAADGNSLITVYSGSDSGNVFSTPSSLFLQKTDLSGAIIWVKKYHADLAPKSVLVLPDGYLIFARRGTSIWVLLKTDKEGNLLTAKQLDYKQVPFGANDVEEYQHHQAVLMGDHLFFMGNDRTALQEDILLLKTDLNLDVRGGCEYLTPFAIQVGNVANPVRIPIPKVGKNTPATTQPIAVSLEADFLLGQKACTGCADTCNAVLDLGPDRSVCQGQTIMLDAGSSYVKYNWATGDSSRTIGVATTGNYAVEVTDSCGSVQRDTVRVTVFPQFSLEETIQFYPGDTITIDGKAYTQSGTVVQNFTTPAGCDSVVTNILQLVITTVNINCPADLTVTLPPNQTTTVVDYNLPTANTNCPDSTIKLTLLQGLPVGGSFPQGTTQVCYEAANQCGIRDTCCFTITAQLPDPPCDVKAPTGCVRYELLNITLDALGQRRYRVRMTNTCASPLEFAYIQLPNGVLAVSPQQGATYTAPGGNTYAVRNPNASLFYSVRYKAVTGSLNNGKNDVFEYVLPQQSQPVYIHVAAKLADGVYSEAHLNTYNCPVQPYQGTGNRGADGDLASQPSLLTSGLSVWPNPTEGTLFVDVNGWQGQALHLQVLNAQGQVVLSQQVWAENGRLELALPAHLASGLYYLVAQPEGGERAAVRFVLER